MSEQNILLEDLLRLRETEQGRIKIKFNVYNGCTDPIEEWLNNKDKVNKQWLFWHNKSHYFRKGDIAICMVRTLFDKDVWLLTTIQKVTKVLDIQEEGIGYEGEELTLFSKYFGRVLVRFHKKRATGYDYANIMEDLVVQEVLPIVFEDDAFPGYDKVFIGFRKLNRIVDASQGKTDWINALENQKAVYLITDTATGKLYVGSATGQNGMLLQRWRDYAATGHGGNKYLTAIVNEKGIGYIRDNFHYSILENYNSRVDDEFILKREQWWMKVLDSKAHGYNN